MAERLRNVGIEEVFICGLALDYCVLETSIDAAKENFKTNCIFDLTKGITADSSLKAIEKLLENGVTLLLSKDIV